MKPITTELWISILLILCITACGGSGGGQSNDNDQQLNQDNSTVEAPDPVSADNELPDTSQATNLIAAYGQITFNKEIGLLEDDERTIDRNLSAIGQLGSGNRLRAYQDNFNLHAGAFIDDTKAYILDIAAVYPTNADDTLEIINYYNVSWLEKMIETLESLGFTSSATNSIKAELTESINTDFELLKLSLVAVAIL